MTYLFGALAGLAWGSVIALINALIMKKGIEKNTTNGMMVSNAARMAMDVVGLGVIFLLRNVLPFSFVACIVATATAMSFGLIIMAYRFAAK